MTKVIEAVYDGEVLRPSRPLDLKPHATYRISIDESPCGSQQEDAWEVLGSLAGSVDAPEDWAREHDHYLYGTPKRRETR